MQHTLLSHLPAPKWAITTGATRWWHLLLILTLFFGSKLGVQAQPASTYIFTPSSGTFTPITGGTAVPTLLADDVLSAALPIGFSFTFEGTAYTTVTASSNSFLSFGTPASSLAGNDLTNIAASARPLLAPLWDDNDGRPTGATASATYLTTGTAPNRVFTFEWINWEWRFTASTAVESFQVKLYEGTNVVQYVYRQEAGATNATATSGASIGLAGAAVGNFLSLSDAVAAPTASSTVENQNIFVKPATGQIYTFTPPTCFPPTALVVSGLTTTGANVAFTAPTTAAASGYTYRYRVAGSTGPYTTVTLPAGATSVALTALNSGTIYEFGIQANCSASDASSFATTTFTTNCLPIAAPYANTFDVVTAPALPPCFRSIVQGGGTAALVETVSSTAAVSTPNYLRIYPNSSAATAQIMLVSPQFSDLGGGSNRQARFQVRSSTAGPTLQVGVLSNPTDPTTFTAVGPLLTPSTTFTEYSVLLSSYMGTGQYVAFKVLSPTSTTASVYIDDFFYEVPPACARPTAVTAGNIGGTTASVSFLPGNGNTSFLVTATPTTGTPLTFTGSASPIALTGLALGTTYSVTVTGNCAAGATAVSPALSITTSAITNDNPAGAIAIPITTTCTTPTQGTNVGGTTTPVNGYTNPGCGIAASPIDVWYTFTTAATGPTSTAVQINITGNPAGQVRVFSSINGAAGPFTQIGCSAGSNNNIVAPSFFVNNLTPSTTYYIFVSGYGSGDTTGPFTLCVTTPPALPTITSFTPTSGPAGTSLVITGTNFTGTTAVTFFGGVSAPGFVVNAAGTQITVTVPAGVFTGPITVTTPATSVTSQGSYNSGNLTYTIGTDQTTCSGTIFDSGGPNGQYQNNENRTTVLTPATAGSKVNLSFSVFDLENNFDFLTIYDGPSATAPQLVRLTGTTLPGSVTATNSTGQLTLVFTSDVSQVRDGFAAAINCVANVPNITSFTPATGLPGTSVVITGTNFTGTTSVTFNNVNAPGFVVNAAGTQITVNVPVGATTGRIRVVNNSVTASSGTDFTVPAPTLTSFTPTSGPAGTSVVITGTNFTGATSVSFNGVSAPGFVVNSATQITVTVPANALSGSISVITPAGTATSTATYNSGNAVYLIGMDQTTCSGIITDSGGPNGQYQDNQNLTTVLTPATPGAKLQLLFSVFDLENNFDFLEVRNGPLATSPLIGRYTGVQGVNTTTPGTGPIVATNPTGQLTLIFTSDVSQVRDGFAAAISCITNPTTITSFTPTSGPAGTTVVLTGTFFTGATSVLFNGTPATNYTVNSATQITVTVPANALSGPISVITPTGGVGVSTGIFNTGNFIIGTNANTCAAVIFDSGGPNGNYSDNDNLTTVITPSTPGAKAQLTFSSFNTASGDELFIYDGPNTNAPLLGTFSGTTNPGTITATTFGGQLTVVFTSNNFTTAPGFAATISCTAPVPCAPVIGLTATNVTQTTARLNFTAGVGNNSYTVVLTPAGGGPTVTVTPAPTTSPITVTGLQPGISYTASVTPNCTTGNAPAVTVTLRTLLANDDPAGAITIPITATCTTPTQGDNTTSTTTVTNGYFNPGCGFASLPKDVWYKFTTAATGPTATAVQINASGNPAGQVRVFSAPSAAGPFTQVACSTGGANNVVAPNLVVSPLVASTTYYISVSGYGSNDPTGPFTLCVTTAPAAPGVTGVTATSLTANSAVISFTAPNPAPTSYSVTYTTAAGQTVTVTPAPTTSPFTLTGLTAGTAYTVSIVANYAAGSSTPVTVNFTTRMGSSTHAALGSGMLSVFPNPAQQRFTLSVPAVAGARSAELTLVNALGQKVLTRTVALQADGAQVPVEATGLATGLYTLHVRAAGQSATVKVAISH